MNAVHPGTVRTRLARDGDSSGWIYAATRCVAVLGVTPDRAARRSVRLASAPPSVSGGYWVRNKQRQPSQAARDDNAAARLWAVSEELITNAGIELPSLI